jgi:adenosylmethionine-8-amino-7-oxononanoate aminotransferase
MRLEEHHFFARDLNRDYLRVVKGEGVWVFDENGKRYLDACAGANVSGIGHGVKEIGEAMARQAAELAYAPPQHFLNQPTLDLCQRLVARAPEGYNRVMLCSSGSEAIENALKIARQYHVYQGRASRFRMISRWQGFHGNTLAADAVGGSTSRRSISGPMLIDVTHIVPPNCYHCAFNLSYPDCGILCARDLERVIIQEGPENISAFICETVVGAAAGGVTPVPEYYPLVREICDKYGVVWIVDEIMAGVGRTGTFLAIEHWHVKPDIVVLAKGLSSGYAPLSAILVSDKVFKTFGDSKSPYIGGHTYNAHPVTAAAGLAVLDYLEKHAVIEGVAEKGHLLESGLRSIADRQALVGDVRGLGLMWGLEFVRDKATREPFAAGHNVAFRVVDKAMDKGLLLYPVRGGCVDGERGDGVLICPPLTINPTEIGFLIRILDETITEVTSEVRGLI